MDAKSTRRANIARLVDRFGRSGFAARVGTDPNYLSQILSEQTNAQCGDQLARRIEVALAKPRGWLDQVHDDRLEQRIEAAITAILAAAGDEGLVLSPRQVARLTVVVLDRHPDTDPSPTTLRAYFDLIQPL